MRIAFFVFAVDSMGGTERSVISQANALVDAGQSVVIVSAVKSTSRPHYDVDPRVRVDYLVDASDPERPRLVKQGIVDEGLATALHAQPSLLVPARWDRQFTALIDAGSHDLLPRLQADVVVTVTPGLLATAVQLLPDSTAVVHQEHRSSSDRTSGLEPMLTFVPRADVVALLTPSMADWLGDALGASAPTTVVVANPLPQGYKPRSTLDTKVIVAAGRLVGEKQFPRLVQAFSEIADEIPDWRLRIVGRGGGRAELIRRVRKLGLYDRVELPGQSSDMPTEWARASISALTSRSEGLPLVAQEAMAAGVPVVAYDTPSGARQVIRHEVNGLLVGPNSVSGMASALLRLATDDPMRKKLGEGALQSSRQYAPDVLAQRWLDIFQTAIDRRRRSGRGRLMQRVVDQADSSGPPTQEVRAPTALTPTAARTLAMEWVLETARRVATFWFVVPSSGGQNPVLVVPMDDRREFLTELGRGGAPEVLSLVDTSGHGWPERRGRIAELSLDLAVHRSSRVSIEPWPEAEGKPTLLSQACRVDVEFWDASPTGDLMAPHPNAFTSVVPPDTGVVPHVVNGVEAQTLPLMTVPTVRDCTFPIDVVYTWVDGDDPEWDAARRSRLAELTGIARTRESSGRARFVSRDELRYSMRSIHLFAPWVRRIFLVTAGQVPPWLVDHPTVRIVDHSEILSADALPTFNSHAIESSIHKVPDLAEHFIYFNDDFLLGRPVWPETFFSPAGHTSALLSGHSIGLDELPGSPPWQKAAWNNRQLLREAFGVITTSSVAHAPYPHRRSVLEEIEGRFPDAVRNTARSPFRSDTDVSLLSSLAQHYGLITGTAKFGTGEASFVNLSSSDAPWKLRRLMQRDQDFICLGDHHDHALKPEVLQRLLEEFFEGYFPVPAPWERPASGPVRH